MKVLTGAAMKEADRRAIEELGLPGAVLMETAGMRVAELILALEPRPGRVVVAAGPGNNGGDGLVIARLLQRAGRPVSLWTAAPPGGYRGDAALNYDFLRRCAFPIKYLDEAGGLDRFKADLAGAGLAVDALLGTGADRPVEGLMAAVIASLNASGVPVVAVDIPSGVHADSGAVLGCAVRARWTVTFAFPKQGLLLFPGAACCGEVVVGEINIPSFLVEKEQGEVATAGRVRALLPGRLADAHKGAHGRVLLVAGSTGMSGAAAMAGEAALRGGAGLVYVAVPESVRPVLEAKLLEVIAVSLPEESPGVIDPAAAEGILERAGGCGVLAAGPGLAEAPATAVLLEHLIRFSPVPLVLDAGALGSLAGKAALLRQAREPVVITPHAGEMGRLAGLEAAEVQRGRPELARRCAREWRCIVVLKGANTLIALPGGELIFNPTGGPALATAGTGDLLTGLIASLIAQGLAPGDAAVAGAYLHGLAGDLVPEGRGHTAGDVLRRFPAAFQCLDRESGRVSPWGPFHRLLRPLPRTGSSH